MRRYKREWVARRRTQFFAGKACEWCGSTERLELDHIDPEQKLDHKIWSWAEPRRLSEISKCRVLCSDCHKQRHATTHGTTQMYRSHGCRCDLCRRANADKIQRYKLRRKLSAKLRIPRSELAALSLESLYALRQDAAISGGQQ